MAVRWAVLLAACAGLAAPGHAAAPDLPVAAPMQADAFAIFVPRPAARADRLDFAPWTEALPLFVVSMGPPFRMMPPEQIAQVWPVYVPRDIIVEGALLDEARFITARGVRSSDIAMDGASSRVYQTGIAWLSSRIRAPRKEAEWWRQHG